MQFLQGTRSLSPIVAVFGGSFYPFTRGHRDLIERAARLFSKVFVCVAVNPNKEYLYSLDQRKVMVRNATQDLNNVLVDAYEGLVVKYAKEKRAHVLVRGVRNEIDFKEEKRLAEANKRLGNYETIFFPCPPHLQHISSSLVRANLPFGHKISRWVPPEISHWLETHGQIKMPVISSAYDNPRLKAAGIVPYAQGPDGRIYILLGQQAHYPHASAGQWKGFGGYRDSGETLLSTALREAKEETRAVLGANSPCYCFDELPLDHVIATEDDGAGYFQMMLPETFDETVPLRFQQQISSNRYQLEKIALRWVAFQDVYRTLEIAHRLRMEEKRPLREMNRTFYVQSDTENLPLAKDFIKTLLINFNNPQDSIHKLVKNHLPISSSLSCEITK